MVPGPLSERELRRVARVGIVPIGLLIAFLSLKPADPDHESGSAILRFLAEHLLGSEDQGDKIGHALAYATLAVSGILAFPRQVALAAGCCFLYGAAFEVLQGLAPGRTPSAADLLANGTGIAAGAVTARLVGRVVAGDQT